MRSAPVAKAPASSRPAARPDRRIRARRRPAPAPPRQLQRCVRRRGQAPVRQLAEARRDDSGIEKIGRWVVASLPPRVGDDAEASPDHRRRRGRGMERYRDPADLLPAGGYANAPRRDGRGAQGARRTHRTSGERVIKRVTPVPSARVSRCKSIGTAGFEPSTLLNPIQVRCFLAAQSYALCSLSRNFSVILV